MAVFCLGVFVDGVWCIVLVGCFPSLHWKNLALLSR